MCSLIWRIIFWPIQEENHFHVTFVEKISIERVTFLHTLWPTLERNRFHVTIVKQVLFKKHISKITWKSVILRVKRIQDLCPIIDLILIISKSPKSEWPSIYNPQSWSYNLSIFQHLKVSDSRSKFIIKHSDFVIYTGYSTLIFV